MRKFLVFFIRTLKGIGITKNFPEGKGVEDKTRDNALFLSMIDSFNGSIAKKIVQKIHHSLWGAAGINHQVWSELTNMMCTQHKPLLKETNQFFQTLAEFKEPDGTKIRNDRSFEKDYINGRYGAIPYIKN